jgi:hypothetical protein
MSARSSNSKGMPYVVKQEIRNLLAIHCRDNVMGEKSDGETTEGQNTLCEKVFHGSEGYSSVLDQFMDGKGVYEATFNALPLENNRAGNEMRSTGSMLELKSILHCELGARYVVFQDGFTHDQLALDNRGVALKGRAITEKATQGIANYKHTLYYWKQWVGPNNQLPSRLSLEDSLLFVRQKMFEKSRMRIWWRHIERKSRRNKRRQRTTKTRNKRRQRTTWKS